MAAMFLLFLGSRFRGHDEAGLSPNTKVFGC